MARTDIAPATVVESTDDEGAPYFHARVPIQDETMIDIAEGHHRASCEATCLRFHAIPGQRSTEATVGGNGEKVLKVFSARPLKEKLL